MQKPPIVIIGMHRSGTSMITKMLENLGLFVGTEKDINNESVFFYEINNWIFDIYTATAEKPYNLKYENEHCKNVIFDALNYFITSNKRKDFLGDYTNQYKSIKDLDIAWGWKDPKNTYTIDWWKHIFPNAKIIHIYRNPIDSVASFIERDLELKNKFEWNWKKKLKRNFLISKNFHQNFRLTNIEEGYDLWEEYVSKALTQKNNFECYYEMKYEDFLENPKSYLDDLVNFCGLNCSNEQIENEIKTIKKSRSFAFLNTDNYVEIYQKLKNKPLMQQLGYNKIV